MSTNGSHDKEHGSTLPLHETSTTTSSQNQPPRHSFRTEAPTFLGEFIGTFMFLSMAFSGTQIALNAMSTPGLTTDENPPPDVAKLLYISFIFGVSLAVNVAIFADVSGGKFNPAVTTALLLTRKIHWHRAAQTIVSQLIASIAASAFISALLPGPLTITTSLSPAISLTRGLFLEATVTAQLVLTILMLERAHSKPMYIGAALFVAEMSSVYFTGGSLNPARSFGPAVVAGFKGSQWVYWVGPLLGAGVASGAYAVVEWVRRIGA